jgi:hypothetical protein
MAITDDLTSAAALCANAADAATDKLIGLGPRPTDPTAGGVWDSQDTLLKNKISILNNLSSSISALIVSEALQNAWPQLDQLNNITNSAENDIARIANTVKVMVAIASVVNFGVAVVTLAMQPTPSNAASVVTALKNMITGLTSS